MAKMEISFGNSFKGTGIKETDINEMITEGENASKN